LTAARYPTTDAGAGLLDRLLVLSTTYRDASTGAREDAAARLAELDEAFEERVLLHTCHRAELIGVVHEGRIVPDLAVVSRDEGAEAAERLLLVAGGLDSAVIGEEEILGQVRGAYEAALAAGQTGPILNELFRRAIRFGKRVRSEAQPRTDRSLADRAVRWLDGRLGPRKEAASALVIGSGTMGRLLAQRLAAGGLTVTVASRSGERAARVTASLPRRERHRAALLDEALSTAATHAVVAIAVRSASSPVERRHLAAAPAPPLVVDLSAPRAVTTDAAELLGDRLLDLDRLGSEAGTASLSPAAERRLRAAAATERDRFAAWLEARAGTDGVALLRTHASEIRRRHLDRLRRSRRLDDEQMAAVEAASAAMVGELLHGPSVHLRRDPAAAATVRRIFGFDR
jgi:glutamyl-tRNA reductase